MDLLDFVFPKKCIGCYSSGKYLCLKCVSSVKRAVDVCPYCFKNSIDGATHFKCKKRLGLDGVISVWEYDGVIKKGLVSLKYKYATQVGDELFLHFWNFLKKDSLPKFKISTAIPMYWYKENTRGFNQSVEFGKFISQKIGTTFMSDLITRKKNTKPQVSLNKEKRLTNLNNAFEFDVKYKHQIDSILLIDDVFTTGTTLKECCRVLKANGVARVWGLTIAKRSVFFR